jgi:hypothetical protein
MIPRLKCELWRNFDEFGADVMYSYFSFSFSVARRLANTCSTPVLPPDVFFWSVQFIWRDPHMLTLLISFAQWSCNSDQLLFIAVFISQPWAEKIHKVMDRLNIGLGPRFYFSTRLPQTGKRFGNRATILCYRKACEDSITFHFIRYDKYVILLPL